MKYGIQYMSGHVPVGLRVRRWMRREADGWVELPWRTLALLVLAAALLVAVSRLQAARLDAIGRDLDRVENALGEIRMADGGR